MNLFHLYDLAAILWHSYYLGEYNLLRFLVMHYNIHFYPCSRVALCSDKCWARFNFFAKLHSVFVWFCFCLFFAGVGSRQWHHYTEAAYCQQCLCQFEHNIHYRLLQLGLIHTTRRRKHASGQHGSFRKHYDDCIAINISMSCVWITPLQLNFVTLPYTQLHTAVFLVQQVHGCHGLSATTSI